MEVVSMLNAMYSIFDTLTERMWRKFLEILSRMSKTFFSFLVLSRQQRLQGGDDW
jgi:hypothetical protein